MHRDLPIIDISPYLPHFPCPSSSSSSSSPSKANVVDSLHAACRDVGFFYLRVVPFVSRDEMQQVLDVAREFFQRPQEEKDQIALAKSDGTRGERGNEPGPPPGLLGALPRE